MKKLALLSLVFLIGCSSSPEKPGGSSTQDQENGLMDMSETGKSTEAANQPLPPVTVNSNDEKSKDKNTDELDRAIQKQDDRAIAVTARQVLIQNPQDVKALNALALYHFRRGELSAAKALLNKAIAANENVSMLYSNLGIVLQASKEDVDAVRAFREALKVDPYNAIAAANVGAYYAQMKDYEKARLALEIAVEKGQRDWRTLSNYGVSLMALGQFSAAEPHLKKSSELQPQNAGVLLNYAILLVDHLNKQAEGLAIISKIRFVGPSPEVRKKISELENRAKSLK